MPLAHHHDPGHHLPGPVQVGDPPPVIRPFDDLADILDANRRTVFTGSQNDIFKILQGPGVTPAPHHVLGAAEFDQPPAHFFVAALHRLGDPADGQVVSLKPVGVHIHLVLPDEPAHRRHLRDPVDCLQVIPQIPILVGA